MNITIVWIALSAVTLISLGLSRGVGQTAVPNAYWTTAFLLGIAFLKVWLVIRAFMEVQHAPAWLRRVTDAWVLLVPAVLLGITIAI
jgi:Prokaryotic Cytochrome C oxidase subunit IV